MAYSLLAAGKRVRKIKDYAKLNAVGTTDEDLLVEADAVQLLGNPEGNEDASHAESSDDSEISFNDENWSQRRLAVSDENYKKEEENYQAYMRLLNERELVLEREKKLLEMKEATRDRQKRLRKMEREIAARNAVLDRYDDENTILEGENVPLVENEFTREWPTEKTQAVNSWVQGTNRPKSVKAKSSTKKASDKQVQFSCAERTLNDAMKLADDNNLIICRDSGTSRLNSLGLSRDQLLQSGVGVGTKSKAPVGPTKSTQQTKLPPVVGAVDDGESICSFGTRASHEANRSDKSENRKIRSGMYDKIADDVVMKLKWPHKKLPVRWVTEKPTMQQMSFEQVVAGELSIIQKATDPEEVRSRIHILKKLACWNMQDQGWPRVREVYIAILHSIEEGESTWKSTFDSYDPVFPVKMKSLNKKFAGKKDVFWCRAFNRGECSQESGHKAVIAGQERVVLHICATCWKHGKKEKHRETESNCPHKEL